MTIQDPTPEFNTPHRKPVIRRVAQTIADATGVGVSVETGKRLPEELSRKSLKGKLGFAGATALSLSRFVYEGIKLAQALSDAEDEPTWRKTAADALVALTDVADGEVARRTGGTTSFGGALDPLCDKWPYRIRELAMAKRGVISPAHSAIRLSRDLIVTRFRAQVDRASEGHVSVAARSIIDPTSSKYSTADYMVTDIFLDSPWGQRLPRPAREVLAGITTAHVVFTGVKNIIDLRKELQTYQRDPEQYIADKNIAATFSAKDQTI